MRQLARILVLASLLLSSSPTQAAWFGQAVAVEVGAETLSASQRQQLSQGLSGLGLPGVADRQGKLVFQVRADRLAGALDFVQSFARQHGGPLRTAVQKSPDDQAAISCRPVSTQPSHHFTAPPALSAERSPQAGVLPVAPGRIDLSGPPLASAGPAATALRGPPSTR